mgnify:CR=1 FL=1
MAEYIDIIFKTVYTIIEVTNMYIEDEYTELKIELTKDIKKEIIAFANTKGGKYTLVLMMAEMLLV